VTPNDQEVGICVFGRVAFVDDMSNTGHDDGLHRLLQHCGEGTHVRNCFLALKHMNARDDDDSQMDLQPYLKDTREEQKLPATPSNGK